MKLKGIIPPIGTPINNDETVDEAGMRRLVNYMLDGGVNGIFVNGTMGCFALLTDAEQKRAIEIVVDEVGGRVPVIAGVSDSGTKRVLNKIKEIESIKVDYITAVPPYYYRMSQDEGKRFFKDVANASKVPVLVYNNPYLTNLDLDIRSLVELSEEPNIIGFKETNQDCNRWVPLLEEFRDRDDFCTFFGTELLIPQCLMMGADGVIGGAHNMAPRIASDLYRAVKENDYDTAFEKSRSLKKVCDVFKYGNIWGGFETALQLLGVCDKVAFEPFGPASEDDREKIREILEDCGLLVAQSAVEG